MHIVSFDVNIEPGWENSTSPYRVTVHHRDGKTHNSSLLNLDGVVGRLDEVASFVLPVLLEKYRQIPYEFRDQIK